MGRGAFQLAAQDLWDHVHCRAVRQDCCPADHHLHRLPRTYMPINNFNSLSTTSYPYSLPLTYNTQYPMSNIYTNSFPLASNWFAIYNIKPSNNIVPASTRTIPSIASTRATPSISSPLVRALYNPAVVQPLKAIKQMTK